MINGEKLLVLRKRNREQKIKDEIDNIRKQKEAERLKEWEQKFDEEQKLREQEEFLKEAKLRRREEEKQTRIFGIREKILNINEEKSSDDEFSSKLENFEAKQRREN